MEAFLQRRLTCTFSEISMVTGEQGHILIYILDKFIKLILFLNQHFILQIVVLWTSDAPIAHKKRWPLVDVPLVVVRPETKV